MAKVTLILEEQKLVEVQRQLRLRIEDAEKQAKDPDQKYPHLYAQHITFVQGLMDTLQKSVQKSPPKVEVTTETQVRTPGAKKNQSRAARWQAAASAAVAALEELKSVQDEYEEWKDNLPENLQNSAVGEKLEAVCDLDVDGGLDTANEADGIDLPLGFGRD